MDKDKELELLYAVYQTGLDLRKGLCSKHDFAVAVDAVNQFRLDNVAPVQKYLELPK